MSAPKKHFKRCSTCNTDQWRPDFERVGRKLLCRWCVLERKIQMMVAAKSAKK